MLDELWQKIRKAGQSVSNAIKRQSVKQRRAAVAAERKRRVTERARAKRGGVSPALDTTRQPPLQHPDRQWQPNPQDRRADGSLKGRGFLGVLNRPDGRVSSELSVGVEIDGKEMEIPLMVPTLNKGELDYLLKTPPSPDEFKSDIGKGILDKAVTHAKQRIALGRPVFADEKDEPVFIPSAHDQGSQPPSARERSRATQQARREAQHPKRQTFSGAETTVDHVPDSQPDVFQPGGPDFNQQAGQGKGASNDEIKKELDEIKADVKTLLDKIDKVGTWGP